ncbi:MAG TPA: phage Gp37/Gp68 family protein [Phycisphaerales bacterium]|nr:phage Gp37/Gp68 family protein [Phycisphaerales bacterium]
MASGSRIEWTQATWNPTTGCTRVSAGCDHCYAARMSRRLELMGCEDYEGLTSCNRKGDRHFNGTLKCHEDRLEIPRRWRAPRLIFVNSMSDLFHKNVPLAFIKRVFKVMNECSQHTFQVLTKRPEIAAEFAPHLEWTPNIWIGTSVENMLVSHRVRDLVRIKAQVRFLSLEPLLGPLPRLALTDIHWVIVGGESGPGARPMEEQWVKQIRDRCVMQSVPFFFKQWGGVNKKKAGRKLRGEYWDEMPTTTCFREDRRSRIGTA